MISEQTKEAILEKCKKHNMKPENVHCSIHIFSLEKILNSLPEIEVKGIYHKDVEFDDCPDCRGSLMTIGYDKAVCPRCMYESIYLNTLPENEGTREACKDGWHKDKNMWAYVSCDCPGCKEGRNEIAKRMFVDELMSPWTVAHVRQAIETGDNNFAMQFLIDCMNWLDKEDFLDEDGNPNPHTMPGRTVPFRRDE